MKCSACGKEITEGSLFCKYCGAKVNEKVPVAANVKNSGEEFQTIQIPVNDADYNNNSTDTGAVCETTESTVANPHKNKTIIFIIIGVVIAALIALLLIFFKPFSFSDNTDKGLLYIKKSTLYYTPDMDKDDADIEVTKLKLDDEYYGFLKISDSGKYIYYSDNVDNDGIYSLYSAEVSKMKPDSTDNDIYCNKIASNVTATTLIDGETKLLYLTKNGKLIYTDGKNETDIDKNVDSYELTKDQKNIVYINQNKGKNYLNCFNLETDNNTELDKDIYLINNIYMSDYIIYTKNVGKNKVSLCYTDFEGNVNNIEKNIVSYIGINNDNKTVYYTKEEDTESKDLYSFVNDTYAEKDAGFKEPELMDFLVPCEVKDVMDSYELDYYTKYPDRIGEFYDYLYYDYDFDMWTTYKYSDYSTSGYTYFLYDDTNSQWYRLNEDKYYDVIDEMDKMDRRDSLRKELKSKKSGITDTGLYCCVLGQQPTCINNSINSNAYLIDDGMNIVSYYETNYDDFKVDIDDIFSASNVEDKINEYNSNLENSKQYYCIDGESYELKLKDNNIIEKIQVSDDKTKVVVCTQTNKSNSHDYSSIILYDLVDGKLCNEQVIADEGIGEFWSDNSYYYFDSPEFYGFALYGDLYKYTSNGKEKIMGNIEINNCGIYNDDNVVGYSSFDYKDGGALKLRKKDGDTVNVAKNVDGFIYINENRVVYIKNGDLYVYTGKDEDRRIARNVLTYNCNHDNSRGDIDDIYLPVFGGY